MENRRRALVLSSEAARHPFRRSLPPHVLKVRDEPVADRQGWWLSRRDYRDFFTAYCTSFVAVFLFIS